MSAGREREAYDAGRLAGFEEGLSALPALEWCPQCGGQMKRVTIDGHESWDCPVDAYAYAVDQDDDEGVDL